MTTFTGFGPQAFAWFTGLERDNSREYFTAHRDTFETAVRNQMEAMLDELAQALGGEVKLFRQHRDVRFSRDKSPYKTNTYGIVRGTDLAALGLYASISAHGLVAGSGYHVMARDQLERYRAAVDDACAGSELQRLVAAATQDGLELWGESLITAPRGYPKDHPRITLLARKTLTLGATLPARTRIDRDAALGFVSDTWRAAAPVTRWLDAHVGASTLPPVRRGRR